MAEKAQVDDHGGKRGERGPAGRILWPLYGRAAYGLIHGIASSCSWLVIDEYKRDQLLRAEPTCIYAFWHGRQFLLVYAFRGDRVRILVSRSRDGEMIHWPLHYAGLGTVRGSTSRGGREAYQLLSREVRQGSIVTFTPDGPRGPARTVAPGVIALARRSGVSILPLAAAARRAWHASSWDSFLVPCPFTRAAVAFGTPLRVPADIPDDRIDHYREELVKELNRLTDLADAAVRDDTVAGARIERRRGRGLPSLASKPSHPGS
ncbi:lysophospholipid acyltransferase family protein [bacterium]|nr:lysophospholipid acyltransferase family protein [candidate division CSSED10-310 bacterium]